MARAGQVAGAAACAAARLTGPARHSTPDRQVAQAILATRPPLTCLPTCARVLPRAEGGIEDGLALVAPWGVRSASIRVPVSLWSGEQDRDTPTGHAHWLATAIPAPLLGLPGPAGPWAPWRRGYVTAGGGWMNSRSAT